MKVNNLLLFFYLAGFCTTFAAYGIWAFHSKCISILC